jgi:hypothetical protein
MQRKEQEVPTRKCKRKRCHCDALPLDQLQGWKHSKECRDTKKKQACRCPMDEQRDKQHSEECRARRRRCKCTGGLEPGPLEGGFRHDETCRAWMSEKKSAGRAAKRLRAEPQLAASVGAEIEPSLVVARDASNVGMPIIYQLRLPMSIRRLTGHLLDNINDVSFSEYAHNLHPETLWLVPVC